MHLLLAPGLGVLLRRLDAQSPVPPANLTLEEVVRLCQSGIPEELIVTKIKKNGKAFDLSRQELIDLRKLGVSETVIKYLLDPSQPYTPAPPPQPPETGPVAKPAETKKYPADPLASKVPGDPGLYLFMLDASIRIEIKLLLGTEPAKGLMKKAKGVAYLVGPQAKTRIKSSRPVFYMRLPEGTEIEQLVLVAVLEKNDRREADVAGLRPEVTRPFDSVEVAARLYRITPAKLAPGEYLFLIVGSADPSKGIHGKGYDFGIDEAQQGKKS